MEVIEIPSSPDSDGPRPPTRVQPARQAKQLSSPVFAPMSQPKQVVSISIATSPFVTPQTKRKRPEAPPAVPEEDLIKSWKLIEGQLRCDICKQLLDVPVSLKCFHVFCSFCIRRYLELSGNDYCPSCRVPASSTDIRLESRLAGILSVLGSDRGATRKKIRHRIRNQTTSVGVSRNEVFHKQADMAEMFKQTAATGTAIGRTLLPLYKSLKDKQLVELVCYTDGLEVPPNTPRDEMIRLHKEFVFTQQAAFDAVRIGMFPDHPPTRDGLIKLWNQDFRLKRKASAATRTFSRLKSDIEVRRETADNSETVANLTAEAARRMQEQLRERLRLQREHRRNDNNSVDSS